VTHVTEGRRLAYLLVLPLLFQAYHFAGAEAALPSGPAQYPFVLPSGYYIYFPVDSFLNGTVVQYSLVSNTSVTAAFMTLSQFQDFGNSYSGASNSIVYQNGTSSSQTLSLQQGAYDVLVYAYGETANATLSLAVFPNNPLGAGPLAAPEPSGIASFGLDNQSGVDVPYAIASTGVVGLATISSLAAYNSTAGSVGANPSGATLQLNSVLVVDEAGGGSQVYWCQNTPDFVTSKSLIALADNVWNYSSSGFLSNDSITSQGGGGYVSTFQQNGTTQYFYSYEATNSSYTLPLGLVLLMNATVEQGSGVLLQFGAQATGGVLGSGNTDWFDNVTIHDTSAEGALFESAGNYTTPIGTYYDSELVFAGEGNGEETYFTQLSSSLGLFYTNGTDGVVTPFPSYFSFGQDTAESADNLMMSYAGNGTVRVSVGIPDYDYLGEASGTFTLRAAEKMLGFPGYPSITTVASSTVNSKTTPASGNGNGVPEFPSQLLAPAVLTLIALLSYLAMRRRALGEGRAPRLRVYLEPSSR
jgi:thermopsin